MQTEKEQKNKIVEQAEIIIRECEEQIVLLENMMFAQLAEKDKTKNKTIDKN